MADLAANPDQTTTPQDSSAPAAASQRNNGLANFRAKYPQYGNIDDEKLAGAIYKKFYADKLSRDEFNIKMGLVEPPPPEKPATPSERPDIDVGGTAFTVAKRAAQPFVDTAAGIVQHGAALLSHLGLPVDPKAAEQVANDIRSGYSQFTRKSQGYYKTTDEDHPYTGAAGDVAGQILLYSATGPEFAVAGVGRALPWVGQLVGRLLTRSAQGAALGALQSEPGQSIGEQAFYGALGAAGGEAVGTVTAKGMAKLANTAAVNRLVSSAREAARGWEADSTRLGYGIQQVIDNVATKTDRLERAAATAQLKETIANGGTAPTKWTKATQDAIDASDSYKEATEFLGSKVFKKLKRVEGMPGAGPGATLPKEANDEILKHIMGGDRTAAKIIYEGFTPAMRNYVQRGMFYKAIEKATVNGSKIDPGKLKATLDTPSVKEFLEPTFKNKPIVEGLANLVEEGNNAVNKHPWILAHGVGRLSSELIGAAGLTGYAQYRGERGVEKGAAEFVLFFGILRGINRMMSSQAGMNFLAATGKMKPGTPQMAKALAEFMKPTAVAAGAGTAAALGPQVKETAEDLLPSD